MLRKLSGQGYPADSDYNASYRLQLYLLPDYSFTPQLWADTGQDLLKNFYSEQTTVSKLHLRGSKDEPGLPTQWLEQRSVDGRWLEQVRTMFANQTEFMKTPTKSGRPRSSYGDRLIFSMHQPNYMLITYGNVVSRSADKNLAPTHIEVWTKALYAATLIHLLTGARVYITDKPYLTITRPEEMKTIIEMEGLHPLLYSLLPMQRTGTGDITTFQSASESNARLPLACLVALLDLLAAVWEINAALQTGRPDERRNLDKQVAGILEEVRSNYLAGATLYKERERDKAAPYPAFIRACQILLPLQKDRPDPIRHALYEDGYELMIDKEGEAMVNLAQQITDTSLKLYLPLTQKEGRAHRYESIFRTGIEVIKTNAVTSDDELVAKVAGNILKRLDRIGGGATPTYGESRVEIAGAFAELLVKRLFRELCHGSVSKLTHQENAYADAIYFFTAQQIHLRWEHYKQQKAQRVHEVNHS
jgi:CRISPR type I-D-associated protein Csc3/Cas10d